MIWALIVVAFVAIVSIARVEEQAAADRRRIEELEEAAARRQRSSDDGENGWSDCL